MSVSWQNRRRRDYAGMYFFSENWLNFALAVVYFSAFYGCIDLLFTDVKRLETLLKQDVCQL